MNHHREEANVQEKAWKIIPVPRAIYVEEEDVCLPPVAAPGEAEKAPSHSPTLASSSNLHEVGLARIK